MGTLDESERTALSDGFAKVLKNLANSQGEAESMAELFKKMKCRKSELLRDPKKALSEVTGLAHALLFDNTDAKQQAKLQFEAMPETCRPVSAEEEAEGLVKLKDLQKDAQRPVLTLGAPRDVAAMPPGGGVSITSINRETDLDEFIAEVKKRKDPRASKWASVPEEAGMPQLGKASMVDYELCKQRDEAQRQARPHLFFDSQRHLREMKAKLAADPDFDVMHNPSAPSTWEGRGQKEGGKKSSSDVSTSTIAKSCAGSSTFVDLLKRQYGQEASPPFLGQASTCCIQVDRLTLDDLEVLAEEVETVASAVDALAADSVGGTDVEACRSSLERLRQATPVVTAHVPQTELPGALDAAEAALLAIEVYPADDSAFRIPRQLGESSRIFAMEDDKLALLLDDNRRSVFPGCEPRMCSISADHTLRQWNVKTGEEQRMFWRHKAAVLCLSVDWETGMAVTGSGDQSLALWDIEAEGEPLEAMFEGHGDWVMSVDVDWDNRRVTSKSTPFVRQEDPVGTDLKVGEALGWK
eukprot:g32613.t1